MKPIIKNINLLLVAICFTTAAIAQSATTSKNASPKNSNMNTYVIEREISEAGKFTPEQLKSISQKSCSVLKELGPEIEWVHSYVTGNKIYCIYKAENEEIIREHAQKGGFPANAVVKVSAVISPATAN